MKSQVKALAAGLMAALTSGVCAAAVEPGAEIRSTEWIQVTDRNGVWDEYYKRTPDGADCSFSFRVIRYADKLGVEAYVRDDRIVTDDCKPGDDPCTTWKDDCLEVFFDGDADGNPNTRGPDENNPLACNAGGEYAIAANGATQSDYASAKKCFGRLWGGVAEPWREANGLTLGTHYKLWFDWRCLGSGCVAPPADRPIKLKMTICIHDDDDGGACDHALYWKGNPKIPYADESAFGTIELGGASDATSLTGSEFWGGRKRHPATVNAWGAEPSENLLSLRGEWDFGTKPHDASAAAVSGIDRYFDREKRKVRVPGCWEASGVGEPGLGNVHLGWDNGQKGVRHVFTGKGLYRKRVKIPESWRGKRVWLKVGGVRSVGWFFVNGKAAGQVDVYAGAWKYDVTDCVTPGETASVVAVADNKVGCRNTQCDSANKWGGLVRDVELEATPETCIDDAWVRGDFDGRAAEAHVRVDGVLPPGCAVRVTVDGRTAETAVTAANAADVRVRVPLAAFRPWSPADPHLYVARVELLADGRTVQARLERFGVRKLEVVGREFRLNGQPFYFRGYGDDSSYPLTGVSPASREYHLAHLRKARAAGFNYVRLHTHCEVPEFFEAADEAGILVQPELSYYYDNPMDHFSYDPIRDATERWVAFRRHPSWAVSSSGNEGFLGARAGEAMYAFLKRIDPDRLVQEEDGRGGLKTDHEGDGQREDFRTGPLTAWWPGSWDPPMPFVCHEYLNLSVKQDSRLEPDFTGVWLPPATRTDRAATLAKAGLTHRWGDRLQDAQHAAQKLFQKLGVETARRDPQCDGYCYWTVADVAVFNEKGKFYTAQGWLDPFWRVKNCGATERDFAVFNSPSCLLLDLERLPLAPAGNEKMGAGWGAGRFAESNRVYASGQTIDARFLLALFEREPLKAPTLNWRLETADGATLAKGGRKLADQPLGNARPVADVAIAVPELAHPVKASLKADVAGVANEWDFWLFPKRGAVEAKGVWFAPAFASVAARYRNVARTPAEARVVVAAEGSSEAKAAAEAGRALLALSGWEGEPNHRLGWWWIGKQTGTAFVRHPALGDFPHEPFLSPLHFKLIRSGTELPAAGVTEDALIAAGEGGLAFFAYLWEGKTARGARSLHVSGLDLVSDTTEGAALLDRLLAYLTGQP